MFRSHLLFVFVLFSLSERCQSSWGDWFSSSSSSSSDKNEHSSEHKYVLRGSVAEVSIEGFNDPKGIELIKDARTKMDGPNTCYQKAYRDLFAGCSKILAEEETRYRLAWQISDCFQKESGKSPFPVCDQRSSMKECGRKLDDVQHGAFREFYIQTNSICHQLQTIAFKHQTERLVNELKKSAEFAEDKLEIIDKRSQSLLHSSNEIYDSLTSMESQTQQVAQTLGTIGDHVDVVLHHSEAVIEQAKGIAASQSELQEGQDKMKGKLQEGMTMLHDSYKNLGREIDNLRSEATDIVKEMIKIGDAMFLKMYSLQSRADDIGNMVGISLDKQKELLDGQFKAFEGIQDLTKFQSQALEESRSTLKDLAEFGHRQQEELLQRHEQLQQAHDQLVESSESILKSQEAFGSKQASMFDTLDKLFDLCNSMLLESRVIKALLIYAISMFILYMLTGTKQTYTLRPWLYTELCATFLIELAILRFSTNDIKQQAWMINLIRSSFVLLASVQLLHAIFTYRDYEVLNHRMLLTLIDKVNDMQRNKDLSWEEDSDISWSSWIDTDLPEEVDSLADPDYMLREEVGENSIVATSSTRKYDLRRRKNP